MLSTPILFVLFTIFFGLLALQRSYRIQKKEQEKNLRGLDTLTSLMNIIKLTQQHRGLQTSIFNGQKTALNPLLALENQLNHSFRELTSSETKADKTTLKFIHNAQKQWLSLLKSPNKNINKNFQQHSKLIQRLLDCLWDLADEYALTSHPNKQIQNLASDLIRTLPELTEAIGQVRAITLQIANSRYCSADKKLQLLFTLSKIQRELPLIRSKLDSESHLELTLFIEETTRSVEDQELSNRNPETFFVEASLHIDVIFNYIQAGLNDLKGQVIHHSRQKKRI